MSGTYPSARRVPFRASRLAIFIRKHRVNTAATVAPLASSHAASVLSTGNVMTGKALARCAESKGWYFLRRGSRASHMIYAHPKSAYRITIPDHGTKDLARGTLESIVKQIERTWRLGQ
jgi:predicted RNA binding protein YcfA (HicA-like mRNA interferase family)